MRQTGCFVSSTLSFCAGNFQPKLFHLCVSKEINCFRAQYPRLGMFFFLLFSFFFLGGGEGEGEEDLKKELTCAVSVLESSVFSFLSMGQFSVDRRF